MKTKNTILAVMSAVLIGLSVTTVVLINQPKSPPPAKVSEQSSQQATIKPELIEFTAVADKNVLDQLKAHATVVTKESQYGPYIDSINGIGGGKDGKYWAFYINGTMAQVGAAAFMTEGGETVTWKYE